jgi:carboxyl-terminal processing protease
LKLAEPRGVWSEFGNLPPTHVFYEDRRIGDTAYIRFNMFLDLPRVMPAFEKTLKACKPCDGIIIDLRGNPGGIGGMAMGLAGFLVDKPNQKLGSMYMRDATLNFVVNPRADAFTGPVAILIDGTSASTSEIFAGGLQDLGRARVFGTKSAAAALPSIFTRLPNGDGFQYAIANYVSRNGQTLEANGVTPDQEVHLTRDSLLAGRDAVIDAALLWIRSKGEQQ